VQVALMTTVGQSRPSMERFAEALIGGFARTGVVVRPLAPGPCGPLDRSRAGGYLSRWVRYPLAARRVTADVFHIVDHSYAHLVRAVPASRAIVTCHDLILLRAAHEDLGFDAPAWMLKRFGWTVSHLRAAAAVACVSGATRDDVVSLCGVRPERAHVIAMGVADAFRPLGDEHRAQVRAGLGTSARRLVLHTSAGGFYKNFPTVLRVIAAVRDAGIDAALVRVGVPLSYEEVRLAGQLGIRDAIVDVGAVPETRLVELYGAADAFLFPSRIEGFGLPVLEAMACGTPVVISDAPALRELVGEAGPSAAALDVDGLATELGDVLTSRERAVRCREAGLARAALFGWKRTVEAYGDLYDAVAAEADALRAPHARSARRHMDSHGMRSGA
jgi:glycosyltransferase involved in cell wall biosynthesis